MKVNALYKVNSRVERILWYDDEIDLYYSIEVDNPQSMPIKKRISEFKDNVSLGLVVSVEDYFNVNVDESKLLPIYKDIRDTAWLYIRDLVSEKNIPSIYNPQQRSALIKQACVDHNTTKVTLYKYLKKYWKKGMNKNALLPDYQNSGAKGKTRKAGDSKRGRPREKSNGAVGINVDESIVNEITNIKRMYTSLNRKPTLASLYKGFISSNYGIDIPNASVKGSYPSFGQFQYWFNRVDISSTDYTSMLPKTTISLGASSLIEKCSAFDTNCNNSRQKSKASGYVYIIENECMPNLYKIGKTNGNIKTRINQISSTTGVPTPFEEVVSVLVPDSNLFEKELHKKFFKERINSRREFFKFEDRFEIISETIKMVFEVFSKEDFEANDDLRESYKSICKLGRIFKISI